MKGPSGLEYSINTLYQESEMTMSKLLRLFDCAYLMVFP